MDTLWIQNVYICQKSVFMRLVVVLAVLFLAVLSTKWQPNGNQMATIWQPFGNRLATKEKTPAFQPRLNIYFFDALYQLRYCNVCMIFWDAIYPTSEPLANILDLSVTLIIFAGYDSGI